MGSIDVSDLRTQEEPQVIIDEEHYFHQPKKLRLVGVGAGISGILLAYKAKHELKVLDEHCDVQIYEVGFSRGFELASVPW